MLHPLAGDTIQGPYERLAITCTYFVCAKCCYPKKIKAFKYLLTYILTLQEDGKKCLCNIDGWQF